MYYTQIQHSLRGDKGDWDFDKICDIAVGVRTSRTSVGNESGRWELMNLGAGRWELGAGSGGVLGGKSTPHGKSINSLMILGVGSWGLGVGES